MVLVAELSEPAGAGADARPLARNLLSFVKTKDLDLPPPALRLEVGPAPAGGGATGAADGALAVKVTAGAFARDVYLTAGGPRSGAPTAAPAEVGSIAGSFDDNYFDLLPGETRTVLFHPAQPTTTAAALGAALHATTIADSY